MFNQVPVGSLQTGYQVQMGSVNVLIFIQASLLWLSVPYWQKYFNVSTSYHIITRQAMAWSGKFLSRGVNMLPVCLRYCLLVVQLFSINCILIHGLLILITALSRTLEKVLSFPESCLNFF